MRIGSFASEAWKARAAPRKPVWIDGGRLISRAAPLMASTASPREAPGARLNEIVTAGNCPWWAMTSGAARSCTLATVASGTCAEPPAVELGAPPALGLDRRYTPPSAAGAARNSSFTSSTTRYWLSCVKTVEICRCPNAL